MIKTIARGFRAVINRIANEPVATITLVVAGGINWLFSHFSFLPPLPDTTRNTVVTLVVGLVGWVVRQYVTPTRKVEQAIAAATTGGDGQAHAGEADVPVMEPVTQPVVAAK